jgi:DNA modification methylase
MRSKRSPKTTEMKCNIAKALLPLAVPIDSLKEDPKNAKTHGAASIAAIAASLEMFGQQKNIVAHGNVVKVGNGTWRAAKKLGWTHVAALQFAEGEEIEDPDKAATAYALADNRTGEVGSSWNPAVVQLQVETVGLAFDLTPLHFGEIVPVASRAGLGKDEKKKEEADGAPKSPEASKAADEEDEIPEAPKEPKTKRGDLFQLGEHRLLCGDSFKPADVSRLLEATKVDLIVTDPPYAIYGSSTGISTDIADDKMVRPFFERLGHTCSSVIKEFGHVYACCDWRSLSALWDGFKGARLAPKNCIVWDKGGGGLGSSYAQCYELIAFFALLPKQTVMSGQVKRGQRMVHRPNIVRIPHAHGDERQHNAAKPIALFSEFVTNSSDEGESVLDLFGGSGTTAIVCEKLKRRAYVMEIEPRYCDIIIARWEKLTGKKAKLVKMKKAG